MVDISDVTNIELVNANILALLLFVNPNISNLVIIIH